MIIVVENNMKLYEFHRKFSKFREDGTTTEKDDGVD